MKNIINSPKDDNFRTRVNSEIKNELESIFVNTGEYPFSVNENQRIKPVNEGIG